VKRFLALALALHIAPLCAQDWPRQKPIQFVVAFPTTSPADLVARLVAPKLAESVGQEVRVDNRPGGGGNLAAQAVKREAADGYTVLVTSEVFAVNVALHANPGYGVEDFLPVIQGPRTPNLIAVAPSVPARDLRELVAMARKGEMTYASSGVGTAAHLSMERLRAAANLDLTHVPFQPAQVASAAIGGHTHISSVPIPLGAGPVKGGRLRALAVTSAQRSAVLPEVPTVNEQGFSGFDDAAWTAFLVHAGTPQDLVNRLNSDLNAALLAPEVQKRLARSGLEWKSNTSGEFAAFLRSEVTKWAKAVRDSGARVN
jgi:tripartite-type tricarboxylate transporter receptor subunit TctC